MKLKLILIGMFLLLLLTGCASPEAVTFHSEETAAIQTSMAVQIPETLVQFFNGVVIALFTAGFVYIFEKVGWDLRQYAIPLAGTFATWVVTELQGYINTIPEVNDVWLNLLFRVLLALIPAAGVLRIISRQPRTLIEHS
jgi:hypothetical protein